MALQKISVSTVIRGCLKFDRSRNRQLCGPSWRGGERRALSIYTPKLNQVVFTSPFSDVQQPTGNLFNTIFENVDRWRSKVAVECSESGRNYTYNELLEKMPKWAGFLTTLGLEKGDVIAICMPNCPEYPITVLGAVSSGLIVTTLNPNNTEDEITKQLKFSGAKVLVVTASVAKVVLVMKANPSVHIVFNGPCSIPSTFNFQEILSDPSGTCSYPIELTERAISVLPFSSGTTGPPKGVQVSHGAISINIRMVSHPSVMATRFATDTFQETYMSLLPFYHMFGMLIMMIGLHQGAKLVTFPLFQPSLYVNTLRKHRVETLHLVPPLVNFLIQSPDVTPETLSQLRTIIISAAPFSQSVAQVFKKKFSKDVFLQEMFGMTEVLLAMANPLEGERIGSCGKLLSNVAAKVIDTSTGSPLGTNETGELCYKTPSMMTRYYRNEAATSSTIDSDGFLRSGDVGFIDSEGYIRIVDRTKELIKVKGLQVSPSELENVLRKHPLVADVGVVGVLHERYGEVPKAFVVASNEELSAQHIHSFLSTRVASYKNLVGGVSFVKELPRTPTGKLLRRELKLIADEGESP